MELISNKIGINGIININKNKILILEKNDIEKKMPDRNKNLILSEKKYFKKN